MASSMTQYPFLSNILIKPSTETTHRRNITLIRALKDDDSQQPDPVKLALARAKAYKKSIQSNPTPKIAQDPDPVSKNSEFGQNKDGSISIEDKDKGFEEVNEFEVIDKKDEPKVSAIDFVGLGFADKKEGRGLPAGLIPISDPFPSGDLPDVEIIVGDTSKFGKEKTSNSNATTEDETELYKPKVSTWGVFPRPNNISKTYGGGKTIRPGEVLETAESKAAKQARTRQMIAAYNRQMGLLIDPKLKAECEKDLKDGDYLMEMGKLKDAIPFYEKVMGNLVYQSELHGLAALQWSICQDSLNRSNEARAMYEKLQSHPNVGVSKKARQFVFSFQAMEMLKVTSSSVSKRKTGYQNFFDAFVENKNNLSANEIEGEDDAVTQALPYVIFLVSPIFMILVIAVQKRLL
ncbi:hypothetical protein HanXRQr2_Chr16g0768391 [Helianthus annuus]|uniref:Uncharacterized protein n=1 Tax=Helianthus annuus TaxID=4232 RepID=A0A251S2B1_HELAN|nr:uncharacterized protein LOC110918334 [Helianthus annuus]KAF5761727.1 hypothetical protein HanXRQr2_Chr16g0768391 [Helianthus annuus]